MYNCFNFYFHIFKLNHVFYKFLKFLFVLLFMYNFIIFLILTPYQYTFINNLNGKFSNNLNKFEMIIGALVLKNY